MGVAMGGLVVENGRTYNGNVEEKLTISVVIICIIAASAGLMFGYDIAVSGGVTAMQPFLIKFFPTVVAKMGDAKQDEYCIFDGHEVMAFTSSLYIAGLVSSMLAGSLTTAIGRRHTLSLSGLLFLMGTAFSASANKLSVLLLGRILLGFAIGFANQAAPVYLAEMAPPKHRGTLSSAFQFFLCSGSVLASFINFGANSFGDDLGWRFALGCAAIPAVVMCVATFFIPDTPSSLIQRGKIGDARAALVKVRGGVESKVEAELNELVGLNEAIKAAKVDPLKKLFQRRYRPHLVLTVAIPSFQQLTGVNIVAFYAPVLMRSMGSGPGGALMAAILLGAVNLGSVLVSTYMVDKIGRRFLFLEGGTQIVFSQVFIACTLASAAGDGGFSSRTGVIVLILMCFISAAFGWSWGPLTWLVPSEILPSDLRSTGTGICIACNFLVTFILAQLSLTLFCQLKFGLFLLYGFLTILMTAFVAFFVPETKGIPLEAMDDVWRQHWYWKRFVPA